MTEQLTLTEIQAIALDLLIHVDKWCREHGIDYYVIGGSLIGAIRSKNLVPWDDDIDIAMHRSDYDRFVNDYEDSGSYKLLHPLRDSEYTIGAAKIIDTTTYIVHDNGNNDDLGVFIDVFPLDNIPKPNGLRARYAHLLVKLYNYAYRANKDNFKDNSLKQALRIVSSMAMRPIPRIKMYKFVERFMRAGTGDYIANHWGFWGTKECSSAWCFEQTLSIELDGKKFSGPLGYDEWLRNIYGDYMVPPEEPPRYHGMMFRK